MKEPWDKVFMCRGDQLGDQRNQRKLASLSPSIRFYLVCVKPLIYFKLGLWAVAEVYKKGLTIEKAFPVQFGICTMSEANLCESS